MSDNPLQPELDDELLSAYLDDELAEEERALVEARLAGDPAARQMLDELRHVSQAIRGLPQETLRQNVCESILHRVHDRKREVPQPAPHDEASAPLPKFTIGRTRRGWIWASLAVAAALLIMFVQRDTLEDENGRSIALRREPASLTAAPESKRLSRAQPVTRELAEAERAAAPSAAGRASSAGRAELADELAAAPSPEAPVEIDEDELVVVHVTAKREAIENKVFDQLLVSNGIAVEAESPAEPAQPLVDRYRSLAASSRMTEEATAQPADVQSDFDVVLVEAPPTKIISFMADLNRDDTNYLGVSVDDSAPDDKVPALQGGPTKKISLGLEKYNRGVVSQQQKDYFARNKAMYYQQSPEGAYLGAGRGGALDTAKPIEQEENLRQRLARDNYVNQGRAQRVQVPKTEDRQGGGELHKLGRQLKASSGAERENLQVLFVLAPSEEPAASPPAENRAE